MGEVIRLNNLKLPKGSKEGNRCLSIGLTPETVERIDRIAGPNLRSAWIERACRLMLAVQEGDDEKMQEWAEWAHTAAIAPMDVSYNFETVGLMIHDMAYPDE